MCGRKESGLRRPWRLTPNSIKKVRTSPPSPKDVKNEGRSGNLYENKGSIDIMSEQDSGISARLRRSLPTLSGLSTHLVPIGRSLPWVLCHNRSGLAAFDVSRWASIPKPVTGIGETDRKSGVE